MNCNFSTNLFEQEAGRSSPWTQPCDGCRASPSVVYCHADAAYLCASCDTQVHSANHVASHHERVRVCEVCKGAPALLPCRADATALCATCDAKVHSANPLAQRHQRVPVPTLPAASGFAEAEAALATHGSKEQEVELDSWLLLSKDSDYGNRTDTTTTINNNSAKMYSGEGDQHYFDLIGYNSLYGSNISRNPEEQYIMHKQQLLQRRYAEKERGDCVMPSQFAVVCEQQHQSGYGIGGAEQAASITAGVTSHMASVTNSISLSSMEVGIVPENTVIDISNMRTIRTRGENLLSSHSLQTPVHLSSINREAMVLRYKEKKQKRKFEKTVRYATRKAYAEARPRIKGRFAKR